MDMSGAMPSRAWIEIEDDQGRQLGSYPSEIYGGTVSTRMPGFEGGTRATVIRCLEYADGKIIREVEEDQLMIEGEAIYIVEMG
jgi:hypothetical protein